MWLFGYDIPGDGVHEVVDCDANFVKYFVNSTFLWRFGLQKDNGSGFSTTQSHQYHPHLFHDKRTSYELHPSESDKRRVLLTVRYSHATFRQFVTKELASRSQNSFEQF